MVSDRGVKHLPDRGRRTTITGTQDAAFLFDLPVAARKGRCPITRAIPRPRARCTAASDKAVVSRLCRWRRRRRAGCRCSPAVPGNPSPLADHMSAYGRAELVPSESLLGLGGGSTLERIASAPLNSDRLPSMRRRCLQCKGAQRGAGSKISKPTISKPGLPLFIGVCGVRDGKKQPFFPQEKSLP